MKQINLDKHLKARDIYPTWKDYIKSARKSITIFSPFFDSLLLKLLIYNKHVPPDNITVITNFKVDNLIENYGQLKTIKTLLDKGIPVLSIDSIHAKILLIDGQHVVIGSQNFTNQGRRNREASIALSDSVENTKFLKILQRWEDEAEPVEGGFVELAIKHLKHRVKEHDEIIGKAKQEFDAAIKEHEQQKERERFRKLDALRKKSSIRFAHDTIYARIREAGYFETYDTLSSVRKCDMTQWITIAKNGRRRPYKP